MANKLFSQPPHSLFSQQVEIVKHSRLFIDDLIQDGSDLHEILNTLHCATELDTLEVRINSSGGFTRYGQQFINVIQDKFKDRCVTVLDAEAASMAALFYMAGDQRIIYPHSMLMVHDVSMYLGGKANETKKQMEVFVPAFRKYFESLFKDTMTKCEVDEMFEHGRDFWFDSTQMCIRGMADFVIVNGENMTATEYLVSIGELEKEAIEKEGTGKEGIDKEESKLIDTVIMKV